MLARVLYVVAGAVGLLLGAVGAVVVPEAAIAGVVLGGLAGVLVGVQSPGPTGARGMFATLAGPRAGLVTGVAVLVGCLVVAGLAALLGSASGVVIVGLALVAAAWWWLRRDGTPHRGADVDEDAAASGAYEQLPGMRPPPGVAAGLSTEELCLAWQRSYFTLLDTPAGPARCHVVALREELLDELERRDRDGFARWLDTDARAGSNPGRHLRVDHRSAP